VDDDRHGRHEPQELVERPVPVLVLDDPLHPAQRPHRAPAGHLQARELDPPRRVEQQAVDPPRRARPPHPPSRPLPLRQPPVVAPAPARHPPPPRHARRRGQPAPRDAAVPRREGRHGRPHRLPARLVPGPAAAARARVARHRARRPAAARQAARGDVLAPVLQHPVRQVRDGPDVRLHPVLGPQLGLPQGVDPPGGAQLRLRHRLPPGASPSSSPFLAAPSPLD